MPIFILLCHDMRSMHLFAIGDLGAKGVHMPPESTIQFGVLIKSANIDEAFTTTLKTIRECGHEVRTFSAAKPEQGRTSQEILDFQVAIENPRDRILTNPIRRFSSVEAVARVVWILGANNRLADIAFYQPKARAYSDNFLSLSGSNYGQRILEPRPGLNQVKGVLEVLRRETGSRRGAIVIWSPEDAIRVSQDIPCAFGLFFHQRGEYLLCTMLMRSNNAFLLLPYNIFEFSLLGEMIAATLGLTPGPYIHFAASMHVYLDQIERVDEAIAEKIISSQKYSRLVMPAMPGTPDPFEQGEILARLEAQLRHEYALERPEELRRRGEVLHEYWQAFYHVLLSFALSKAGKMREAKEIAGILPAYFRESVERTLCE
jgi:thymidylate synthase